MKIIIEADISEKLTDEEYSQLIDSLMWYGMEHIEVKEEE